VGIEVEPNRSNDGADAGFAFTSAVVTSVPEPSGGMLASFGAVVAVSLVFDGGFPNRLKAEAFTFGVGALNSSLPLKKLGILVPESPVTPVPDCSFIGCPKTDVLLEEAPVRGVPGEGGVRAIPGTIESMGVEGAGAGTANESAGTTAGGEVAGPGREKPLTTGALVDTV